MGLPYLVGLNRAAVEVRGVRRSPSNGGDYVLAYQRGRFPVASRSSVATP